MTGPALTIYPEASLSDFGTISGSITNGFSGAAVSAHVGVRPVRSGPGTLDRSHLGELTLRNGTGEYQIHARAGSYAVRIVPLDGVHTTAADANVAAHNGLDIDFETEFNGAGERRRLRRSAQRLHPDLGERWYGHPGINIQTNAYAGRVEIAQYGQFENVVTFRARLPPSGSIRRSWPHDPADEFPSFTFNGVPAPFQREAVLLDRRPLPDIANPISTSLRSTAIRTKTRSRSTRRHQRCDLLLGAPVPKPATLASLNNFPFLRADLVQLSGAFSNSYTLPVMERRGRACW
jgi:hypothetical protein